MGFSGHHLSSANTLFGSEEKFQEKSVTYWTSMKT